MSNPMPPKPLQLLVELYGQSFLVMRLHLRFSETEDSYQYVGSGEAFMGLFQETADKDHALALAAATLEGLARSAAPVSEVAELAPQAMGVFVDALLSGNVPPAHFRAPDSVAKLVVAGVTAVSGPWRVEVEAANRQPILSAFDELAEAATVLGTRLAHRHKAGAQRA
jgi:hypothetical protein